MRPPMTIGVVGGNGWLGGAIAQAIVDAGLVAEEDLALSYRNRPAARFPNAFWTRDNQALADRSDLIVLSVRPVDWPTVAMSAEGKLVVSVMAGVPLAAIADRLGTDRVVRALPNAAAEVRASYSPWFASSGVTDGDRRLARELLAACGTDDEVARETDIDDLTGLSGSGPAFPALLADAMMKDAIGRGIDANVARRGPRRARRCGPSSRTGRNQPGGNGGCLRRLSRNDRGGHRGDAVGGLRRGRRSRTCRRGRPVEPDEAGLLGLIFEPVTAAPRLFRHRRKKE